MPVLSLAQILEIIKYVNEPSTHVHRISFVKGCNYNPFSILGNVGHFQQSRRRRPSTHPRLVATATDISIAASLMLLHTEYYLFVVHLISCVIKP